jgi:hypothetical protein
VLVAPEDPGDVRDPPGEVAQEGMHRGGPGSRWAADSVPGAHRPPDVAARQRHLFVIKPHTTTSFWLTAVLTRGGCGVTMMCVSIVVTDYDPGWPAWFLRRPG